MRLQGTPLRKRRPSVGQRRLIRLQEQRLRRLSRKIKSKRLKALRVKKLAARGYSKKEIERLELIRSSTREKIERRRYFLRGKAQAISLRKRKINWTRYKRKLRRGRGWRWRLKKLKARQRARFQKRLVLLKNRIEEARRRKGLIKKIADEKGAVKFAKEVARTWRLPLNASPRKQSGAAIFLEIIESVKPTLGVRARARSRGRRPSKQYPYLLSKAKQYLKATRWLHREVIYYKKAERTFYSRFVDILSNRGSLVKHYLIEKRSEMLEEALANRQRARWSWLGRRG
jgi:hypothetical protein